VPRAADEGTQSTFDDGQQPTGDVVTSRLSRTRKRRHAADAADSSATITRQQAGEPRARKVVRFDDVTMPDNEGKSLTGKGFTCT